MKKFIYNYQTDIHFSADISRHSFLLRSMPCSNICQQLHKHNLLVQPAGIISFGTDNWGNAIQYGIIHDSHNVFSFNSSGEVELQEYAVPVQENIELFKLQSNLTRCSEVMSAFVKEYCSGSNTFDKAISLAQRIYDYMLYVPGSTAVETTAENAFTQGRGVCQDYAHILIALCREAGIAARYVNGFMQGEGATHAWVEILDDSKLWRGLDPTNNKIIDYGYIKVSHGRDARDCQVCRGTFLGTAYQNTEVKVLVEEI